MDSLQNDVRIEFLPRLSTTKYQPLDLSMFAHGKIRYRLLLLRDTLDVMQRISANDESITADSGSGKCVLSKGQLPHVAGTINIFAESWRHTYRVTVIKFWIKSQCLSTMHL